MCKKYLGFLIIEMLIPSLVKSQQIHVINSFKIIILKDDISNEDFSVIGHKE